MASNSASSASKTRTCSASRALLARLAAEHRQDRREVGQLALGAGRRRRGRPRVRSGAAPRPAARTAARPRRARRSRRSARARPSRAATRISSLARRDLPTPDSPATSASDGVPAALESSAPLSSRELGGAPDEAGAGDPVAMPDHPPTRRLAGAARHDAEFRRPRWRTSTSAIRSGRDPLPWRADPLRHERRPVRHLQAPEARAQHARQRLLDVRALQDRRPLPEVPAAAGGALPGLRQRRLGDDGLAVGGDAHVGRGVGDGAGERSGRRAGAARRRPPWPCRSAPRPRAT